MEYDSFITLFEKIARNKRLGGTEAPAKHKQLVDKLNDRLGDRRQALERAAFGDLKPEPTQNPLGAVKWAIRANDPQAIKQAALNAYEVKHFTAVRLAGEFDQDIGALVDFMMTFGELATLNQQVFIRAALADPPRERVEK